mgnify:CR=1 FL=1
MNLYLLSGNSFQNKAWIEDVQMVLAETFRETRIQYYRHWETGEEVVEFEHELGVISENADFMNGQVVLGKSAGAMLAARAVSEGLIEPAICVFFGVPLAFAREHERDIEGVFADFATPTLFIQQTDDPYASASELRTFLDEVGVHDHTFLEVPGDDHRYSDLETYAERITEFVYG